ncbi:hypothetical protein GCM10011578_094770 [Streptomyces fuscichromogenes]|uniref:Uncharacterized protein n=1 Tax=Streptomyces fuscichromogenes TaxID=1324013 RepID=A0A918CX78_9ACTN|nr:hypothetical protein GCM10011578_094770 [Streptomyces fuscichromogenes]
MRAPIVVPRTGPGERLRARLAVPVPAFGGILTAVLRTAAVLAGRPGDGQRGSEQAQEEAKEEAA